jgi:hypothetical protein
VDAIRCSTWVSGLLGALLASMRLGTNTLAYFDQPPRTKKKCLRIFPLCPYAIVRSWIQTLDLEMMRQAFYHCAYNNNEIREPLLKGKIQYS